MAKEYFQHDYYSRNSLQMKALLKDYKAAGYGIFWAIVEVLHESKENRLPMKTYVYNGIAEQIGAKTELVERLIIDCIEKYDLFSKDENCNFYSQRVEKNLNKRNEILEKRSAAGKKSAEMKALKAAEIVDSSTSVQHNSTHVEQNSTKFNKGKEIKLNEIKGKEIKDSNTAGDESPIQPKIISNLVEREKKFMDSLVPFLPTYGKDMIRKFYDYWREENKSKTKMKFELEKTFQIDLRLKRWAENNFEKKQFGNSPAPTPSVYTPPPAKPKIETSVDEQRKKQLEYYRAIPDSIAKNERNLFYLYFNSLVELKIISNGHVDYSRFKEQARKLVVAKQALNTVPKGNSQTMSGLVAGVLEKEMTAEIEIKAKELCLVDFISSHPEIDLKTEIEKATSSR